MKSLGNASRKRKLRMDGDKRWRCKEVADRNDHSVPKE